MQVPWNDACASKISSIGRVGWDWFAPWLTRSVQSRSAAPSTPPSEKPNTSSRTRLPCYRTSQSPRSVRSEKRKFSTSGTTVSWTRTIKSYWGSEWRNFQLATLKKSSNLCNDHIGISFFRKTMPRYSNMWIKFLIILLHRGFTCPRREWFVCSRNWLFLTQSTNWFMTYSIRHKNWKR